MSVLKNKILQHQKAIREVGQIRIGAPKPDGGVGRPLTTFRLTSTSREVLESAQEVYGGEVVPFTTGRTPGYQIILEQEIIKAYFSTQLLPNGDLQSCQMSYDLWAGDTHVRECDRQTCKVWEATGADKNGRSIYERVSKPCLCEQGIVGPKGAWCDLTTQLKLMLAEIPAVGVWRLTTKSEIFANELAGLIGQLEAMGLMDQYIPVTLKIGHRTKRSAAGEKNAKLPVVDIEIDKNPASLPELIAKIREKALGASTAPALSANGFGSLHTKALEASTVEEQMAEPEQPSRGSLLASWMRSIGLSEADVQQFKQDCLEAKQSWMKACENAQGLGIETSDAFVEYWTSLFNREEVEEIHDAELIP